MCMCVCWHLCCVVVRSVKLSEMLKVAVLSAAARAPDLNGHVEVGIGETDVSAAVPRSSRW